MINGARFSYFVRFFLSLWQDFPKSFCKSASYDFLRFSQENGKSFFESIRPKLFIRFL